MKKQIVLEFNGRGSSHYLKKNKVSVMNLKIFQDWKDKYVCKRCQQHLHQFVKIVDKDGYLVNTSKSGLILDHKNNNVVHGGRYCIHVQACLHR